MTAIAKEEGLSPTAVRKWVMREEELWGFKEMMREIRFASDGVGTLSIRGSSALRNVAAWFPMSPADRRRLLSGAGYTPATARRINDAWATRAP